MKIKSEKKFSLVEKNIKYLYYILCERSVQSGDVDFYQTPWNKCKFGLGGGGEGGGGSYLRLQEDGGGGEGGGNLAHKVKMNVSGMSPLGYLKEIKQILTVQ